MILNKKCFTIRNICDLRVLDRGFSQLSISNIIIWGHNIFIYKIKDNIINLLYKLHEYDKPVNKRVTKVIEAKNKNLIFVAKDRTFTIWHQKSKKIIYVLLQ